MSSYHNAKLHPAFFAAAQQAGLPSNPDFNDWDHDHVRAAAFSVFFLYFRQSFACLLSACLLLSRVACC